MVKIKEGKANNPSPLLDVIEVADKTEYELTKSIFKCLKEYELNIGNVPFQSYDCARSLNSVNKRTQSFF